MKINIKKIKKIENDKVKSFIESQKSMVLEIYNKNKIIYQKNILFTNVTLDSIVDEISDFMELNHYDVIEDNLKLSLNENILELSIPMLNDKNSIKAYIYDKNDLKRQLKEYIKENKMNDMQEELIFSEFEDNNPYLKNTNAIMEQISEIIISQVNENELSELIMDKGINLSDVINTDLSDEIKKIILDGLDESLQSFDNLIKVVKTDLYYELYIGDYLIKKIGYKVHLIME